MEVDINSSSSFCQRASLGVEAVKTGGGGKVVQSYSSDAFGGQEESSDMLRVSRQTALNMRLFFLLLTQIFV